MIPLLFTALVACGLSGRDDAQQPAEVLALRVMPEDTTTAVRTGEPVSLDYTAWATFKDGTEGLIDMVSWESSNLSMGDIDSSGTFLSVDTNGGITEVTATHLGIVGSASLTVVYTEDLLSDGVSQDVVDAFAAASPTDSTEVEIDYPYDQVTVPRNLEGLLFHWVAPEGADLARLRMQSEITDVSVYVQGDSWTATSELWQRIAAANRRGEVEVTVEVGHWSEGTLTDVQRSRPIQLTVNRLDARGSVLYWQTVDEAVMRIPVGTTVAEAFWTREDSDGRCTGCHVVSDAADIMVVSHDGVDGRFTVVDVADVDAPEILVSPDDEERTSFKAISPDGRRMISTNQGRVRLYDAPTGQRIRDYDLDGYFVQPEWSPDGASVLLVRATRNIMSDFLFEGADIVEVPFDGGDLGEPEVLLADDGTYNYYYPAWSPDGEWIAFNRTLGTGYASPDAEVFLMRRDGSEMRRLDNANGDTHQKNSYPRWGPLPDDDVLWLAFSSLRHCPECTEGKPQVWVSAIDVAKAAEGGDPSSAPFRLPGQETASDNHLPFWWSQ